jgi:hypothetical protein
VGRKEERVDREWGVEKKASRKGAEGAEGADGRVVGSGEWGVGRKWEEGNRK